MHLLQLHLFGGLNILCRIPGGFRTRSVSVRRDAAERPNPGVWKLLWGPKPAIVWKSPAPAGEIMQHSALFKKSPFPSGHLSVPPSSGSKRSTCHHLTVQLTEWRQMMSSEWTDTIGGEFKLCYPQLRRSFAIFIFHVNLTQYILEEEVCSHIWWDASLMSNVT